MRGVAVGYLVLLAALGAAVAALTSRPADANSKKTPPVKGTPPPTTAPTSAPATAATAASTAAAKSTAEHQDHRLLSSTHHDAATTRITTAAPTSTVTLTTKYLTAAVERKKSSKTSHHRSTRRGSTVATNPDEGSTYHATGTATATGSVTPATGSAPEAELNLSDVSVLKSSLPGKPFVKQGAYPFVATVQKICGGCHTRHYCAGAILSPLWVLSLPQCAETHPGEALVVRAGDSFIWPGDHTATQKVIEVVWHEASTSTDEYPRYDAILLRLENPFQFSEYLNAINLAPPSHNIEGPQLVLGWSPPGQAQQVELNVTHVSVRPAEDCQKIAAQETLPADTFCAQPTEPFLDHCAYDPGDPVIVDTEPPQLVGLLTRWYHPCTPERPVVAIKISVIYAWIYDKANPPPVTVRPPPHSSTAEVSTAVSTASSPSSASTGPPPTWPPPTSLTGVPPSAPPALTMPGPAGATTPSTVSWTHMPGPAGATTPSTVPWTHQPPAGTTTPSTVSWTHLPPATDATPMPASTAAPSPHMVHVKPMTVSSSSASGALANTTSTSDAALLAGHMESSLSYSLGTAGVEPSKPALSNSVSVGWANCRDVGGALGMSYSLAYSFISEGAASSASTVNATCLEMNAVQSQGWSISTSGSSAPLNVRAFIMEHLASIPGLPRQPTLRYL